MSYTPNLESKIFVAGHRGLVGAALARHLKSEGYKNLVLKTRSELDLRNKGKTEEFFNKEKPDIVFLAAARVGGIKVNDLYRADFIRENLEIQNNVMAAAFDQGVEKFIFLGSGCMYPKDCAQPMATNSLMSGPLEETNEAYAVAKIAGWILCKSLNLQYKKQFITVIPAGVYGPGDNYDPDSSHVLPAFIRRFYEAKRMELKSVTVWGSGKPLREFLYVDDLARALIFLMKDYKGPEPVNIGTTEELSIRDLATLVAQTVGFKGEILWDESKPDGTMRKLLDSSPLFSYGWRPRVSLEEGIQKSFQDFISRADGV